MKELQTLILLAVVAPSLVVADDAADADPDTTDSAKVEAVSNALNSASHKQIAIVETMHDGKKVSLNTFALDNQGNLLACVSATPDSGETKVVGYLQKYSAEGKLLAETELEFVPTAVNVMADDRVIVAGTGKVAQVSGAGKLLSVIPSPHIGDVATLTERVTEEATKQLADVTKRYKDMVDQVDERIKKIEETPEEDRSKRDIALLKSLPVQKQSYEKMATQMETTYSRIYSPESLLRRKMGITSVAVTSKDVFLCCYAIEGRGYDVWRLDHELSAPRKIMTGLGGCCGQCDVQAAGDNLVIGENTKFQVSLVDRDGERLTSFGKKDRSSENGFGSCCNPMNVRCCSNGDIITSESSVGNIKRFSKDGEYLGLIGKAKISGGCKHVAVAHDEERNRFYTMNIDKDHICVLAPLSEAPEYTEEELAAKKALDAHGNKLLGKWKVARAAEAKQTREVSYTVAPPNGKTETKTRTVSIPRSSSYAATEYLFHGDGRMEVKGGMFERYSNAWQAVGHDDSSITLAHLRDGVHYYNIVVEFGDADAAEIRIERDGSGSPLADGSFIRTVCGDECPKKENSQAKEKKSLAK